MDMFRTLPLRRRDMDHRTRFRSRPTLGHDSWRHTSPVRPSGPRLGRSMSEIERTGRLSDENVAFLRPIETMPTESLPNTRRFRYGQPEPRAREIPIEVSSSSGSLFPGSRHSRIMNPNNLLFSDFSRRRFSDDADFFGTPDRNIHISRTDDDGYEIPTRNIDPPTYHTIDIDKNRNGNRQDRNIPISRNEPKDTVTEDVNVAKINKVDAHVAENARAHHTDKYHVVDSGGLVVRRGQGFEITVHLDRRFDNGKDNLNFVFETGTQPLPGKGTHVSLNLYQADASGKWKARISRNFGSAVTVTIETSVYAIIGDWRLTIAAGSRSQDNVSSGSTSIEIPVYILFNPWCQGDCVYFPDQAKLTEYVLNDNGCIFVGTHKQIGANPWFFGQFEAGILEAAIHCLNKAFKFRSTPALGDPVRVTRAISKIVNSNDDKGVVVGNWSGNYIAGKAPLALSGSVEILRQFMRTHSPVKYGQCFVFSGVVTTICRALGIPCRSVTNFSSAHDTDASVSIDVHWESDLEGGNTLEHLNTDSIWNYHVWNDVWMRRSDLPSGNDGWQVLDATPQERSNGVFQCGPSPLAAIRAGQCDVPFDTPFIFAEVNADRTHWGRTSGGQWEVIDVEKSAVGKRISTKVPDGRPVPADLSSCERYREDITQNYKYPEDTERERISVINASRTVGNAMVPFHSKRKSDVKLSIKNNDSVLIGNDFDSALVFENTSHDTRKINGKVICDVVSYIGKKISTCLETKFSMEVEPRAVQNFNLKITASDYLQYTNEAAIVRVSVLSKIQETGATLAMVDSIRLRIPDLEIKVLTSSSQVGALLQFRVSWKNPLNKKLTNCVLRTECQGLEGEAVVPLGSIGACQEVNTVVGCRVQKPGLKQIYVTLENDQLQNVKGVEEVYVQRR